MNGTNPQEELQEGGGGLEDLELHVSLTETNLILEALGSLPFARVYELVGKIQSQARSQVDSGGGSQPAAGS